MNIIYGNSMVGKPPVRTKPACARWQAQDGGVETLQIQGQAREEVATKGIIVAALFWRWVSRFIIAIYWSIPRILGNPTGCPGSFATF
jgi:hypothetical protein